MEKEIEVCLFDFLNLVFGSSPETKQFWDELLIPDTVQYYNYSGTLTRDSVLLNALYFALIHSAGIKLEIVREDKSPILERKRTHGFD